MVDTLWKKLKKFKNKLFWYNKLKKPSLKV